MLQGGQKMDRIYLFLTCLALTVASCRLADAQGPTFPDISALIENGFMSKVEISGMPENYTVLVEEFYDVASQKTKVKTLKEGHRRTIVLDPKFDQVAVIEHNTCDVQSYGNAEALIDPMFPTWLHSEGSGKEIFYGPTSILRRAARTANTYTGISTVRGIECHSFQGKDPNRNGITIDYYFTADWTTPLQLPNSVLIPVQIRLTGEGILVNDVADDEALQYLDFVYFITPVKDSTVFELPYGVGCKGLKHQEIPMPTLPKRFTVSGEQFTAMYTSDTYVNTFRVWYDYEAKLARVDVYTKNDRGVSKVLDYNTGVMYVTRDSEECTAVPIVDGEFDEVTGDLKLVMRDPDAALGMNKEFYYLGKQVTRGILCDVWESVQENATIVELTMNRMVYTYFISSHWWEVAVEGDVEERVPIRLEINAYVEAQEEPSSKTVINFFRFRKQSTSMYSPYNIQNCASDASAEKYIGLVIETEEDLARSAEAQAPAFRTQAQEKIIEIAGISPIRLPYVRVDYEPSAITIMALILERAPAMAQFVELGDDAPKSKQIKKGPFKSAELCAEECITSEVCVGFHYCSGKGECFTSIHDWNEDWGSDVKGPKSCTLYKRQEAGSVFKDVLLKEAVANLANAVEAGKFTIALRVKNDEVVYKASDFMDDVTPVSGGDHDSDMFSRMVGQNKFKGPQDDQTTQDGGEVLSASDCYRKCKSEANIACTSFSFCSDTNQCLLSPVVVLPDKKVDNLEFSPLCSVYTINYLQMFEEYNGQVRISPGKEAISADSPGECAKSCKEKGTKECRGFDYCSSKNQCVLHPKHVLDFPGTDDTTSVGSGCSHYALKYSADFVEMGRYVLFDSNAESVAAASVEQCAKMCAENVELKCRSFDFCKSDDPSKLKCTLNTLTIEDDVKSDDSDTCQHYAKKDGLVEDYSGRDKVTKAQKGSKDDSGYSSNGFAGVVIGLLILGIAIGVIGFFVYAYTKKRRLTDGTAVKFVNQ